MTKLNKISTSISDTHKIVNNILQKTDKRTENTSNRLQEGSYIRITIRQRSYFKKLESRAINKSSGIQRIVGLQNDGNWSTHAWLIKKSTLKIINNTLVGKTVDTKNLLRTFRNKVTYVSEDNYILTD